MNLSRVGTAALWYLFNIPSIADPLPTLLTVLVLQMLNGSSAAVEKSFRTKYVKTVTQKKSPLFDILRIQEYERSVPCINAVKITAQGSKYLKVPPPPHVCGCHFRRKRKSENRKHHKLNGYDFLNRQKNREEWGRKNS